MATAALSQAIVQRTTAQLKWLHHDRSGCGWRFRQRHGGEKPNHQRAQHGRQRCSCGDNGKFTGRALGEGGQGLRARGGGDRAEWGQPLDPEAFRTALELTPTSGSGP